MPFDPEAPRMKLGLIHDHRPGLVPDLAVFATKPLPAPAAKVAVPAIGTPPMALNNQLGDCTIAGVVHLDETWSAITSEPWTYCGDEKVRSSYFSLTGGEDTGLMIDDVLQTWHSTKLGCSPFKIGGFAPIHPQNSTAVKQAIDFFGAAYCGVNLPTIAQQQFQNGEAWHLTGTEADYDIEGGHCIDLIAYDSVYYAITWGAVQAVELAWIARYCTQARAIVPHEFEKRGGDARGLNIAALDQWLTHLAQ